MIKKGLSWLSKLSWAQVVVTYFILIAVVSTKDWASTPSSQRGGKDTFYSNYVIFTNAYDHLLDVKDIYARYKREQSDRFKYSPTFAVFMAPFALLPDVAGLLLWMLVFNHKAESNTFILASVAMWIWYFLKPRGVIATILMISAIILISLSPTDLFPRFLRVNYVYPYSLKAVPAIITWFWIMGEAYWNLFKKKSIPSIT